LFESPEVTPLDFCVWGLDDKQSLQKKGGYTKRIAGAHLDAAAHTKKREDQLRRTTRDLRTRVPNCIEVDGGIFEYLLGTDTDLSFLCDKFVL
jgi:hypothetical protein